MKGDAKTVRVLIVDDHGVVRSGLRLLLQSQADIEVIGEASEGAEAVKVASELQPDVVILDLALPAADGFQVMARLREEVPGCRVLVLTMYDDVQYAERALAAGAHGYVVKRVADRELLSALRAVAAGVIAVCGLSDVVPRRLPRPADHAVEAQAGGELERLSGREREVLRLLALGYSHREISEQLYLSAKTVETYRSRLADKLGLRRRSELVRFAMAAGLISAGDSLGAVAPEAGRLRQAPRADGAPQGGT